MAEDLSTREETPTKPHAAALPQERARSKRPKPSVLALLAGAIILVAAFVYFYDSYRSYIFSSPKPPIQNVETPPPFFGIEATQPLTITKENRSDFTTLVEAALSRPERAGYFKRLIITVESETGNRYADLPDLFSLFGVTPPSLFYTPITGPVMTFAYFADSGPQFGFAVETTDRERVLLALARWEETLPADFEGLYLGSVISKPGIFEEYTYRNANYRFLASASDPERGIAYLVFPAKKYLIVTTSRESMERIIERLFDAL